MTGLLHEKEFSRTAFIKGGGAMVVAISGAAALAANAAATGITAADNFGDPIEAQGYDPPSVDHPSSGSFAQRTAQGYLNQGNATTNINNVDVWLTVNADNTVTVTHGETEVGHGTPTGILGIVAEEMNMSMEQMWYARPESWLNFTGGGGGSGGISSRSTQIRAAAAYAKAWLLQMASTKLNVPVANLTVTNGVISGGGQSVTYGAIVGGRSFASILPAGLALNAGTSNMPVVGSGSLSTTVTEFVPGQVGSIAKPVSQYTVVGVAYPRIDIPSIVTATTTYIQNVRVPGMVHARRVRPRGAGANTFENDTPLSVNTASIANIPGAQVVQIGNFLAVTAPQEYDAIQAAAQLEVQWQTSQGFPKASGDYWSWLRQAGDANTVNFPRYSTKAGNPQAVLATAAHTVSATYHYHYNQFAPIGPHCAVADITPGGQSGIVYIQGQSVTKGSSFAPLIGAVLNPTNAAAASPAPQNIRVVWYEGSASYGGGQSGEAAEEAVIISTKIGKPVRVQWMRWDQQGWEHWGVGSMYDVTMGTDANGNLVGAIWQNYSQAPTTNIDEDQRLLGLTTWTSTPASGGIAPSDSSVYNMPNFSGGGMVSNTSGNRSVLLKSQPMYGGSLKGDYLRAPSAPQTYFASEQVVDELAHANNMDPVAFRAQNIDATSAQSAAVGTLGARWISVLDAATQQAGWNWSEIKQNLSQTGTIRKGRGFAFGTFASTQMGMVADVEVNMMTGKISVKHLTIAQNNGITINPQNVGNQMSGAAIMGVSRCMFEEATWNTERVTNLDWVSYPILRMADCPSVTLVNVHPGQYTVIVPGDMTTNVTVGNTNAFAQGWLASGSGEPPLSACGSAIANAFFNATGARIRYAPMTPATARGALKAAGVLMT